MHFWDFQAVLISSFSFEWNLIGMRMKPALLFAYWKNYKLSNLSCPLHDLWKEGGNWEPKLIFKKEIFNIILGKMSSICWSFRLITTITLLNWNIRNLLELLHRNCKWTWKKIRTLREEAKVYRRKQALEFYLWDLKSPWGKRGKKWNQFI